MSGALQFFERGARHRHLAARVAGLARRAPDVECGLHVLAGDQAKLPTRGPWAKELAAPVFDEVPLAGVGLRRHEVDEARRRAQRRAHAATSRRQATLTVTGGGASPYRGVAAEPVPVERVFAWFCEAGVPIAARRGDAYVAAGDGTECRIDGGGLGSVRIAGLAVAYDDAVGPATVACVLAAHVGAVQVAHTDGVFTIADAGDFALAGRASACPRRARRPGRRARDVCPGSVTIPDKRGCPADGRNPAKSGQIRPFCPGTGQSRRAFARLRLAHALLWVPA